MSELLFASDRLVLFELHAACEPGQVVLLPSKLQCYSCAGRSAVCCTAVRTVSAMSSGEQPELLMQPI